MPPKKNVQPMKSSNSDSIVDDEENYQPSSSTKKTTPYMSNYEYCALISARALLLGIPGNTPKVKIDSSLDYDPINIATREVKLKVAPLVIRRKLPSGESEDWLLKDLILPEQPFNIGFEN
jgi:DNA-directed RNA polymerase I, II, and III subunit RPABC2